MELSAIRLRKSHEGSLISRSQLGNHACSLLLVRPGDSQSHQSLDGVARKTDRCVFWTPTVHRLRRELPGASAALAVAIARIRADPAAQGGTKNCPGTETHHVPRGSAS